MNIEEAKLDVKRAQEATLRILVTSGESPEIREQAVVDLNARISEREALERNQPRRRRKAA